MKLATRYGMVALPFRPIRFGLVGQQTLNNPARVQQPAIVGETDTLVNVPSVSSRGIMVDRPLLDREHHGVLGDDLVALADEFLGLLLVAGTFFESNVAELVRGPLGFRGEAVEDVEPPVPLVGKPITFGYTVAGTARTVADANIGRRVKFGHLPSVNNSVCFPPL